MAKNEVLIKFLGDSSKFDRVIRGVEGQTDGFNARVSKGFSGLKLAAGAAFAGAGVAAIGFGKSLISAATESEKVTNQTEAVLKSMGQVAGVTANQVADLSAKMALKSGVDDEVIQSAQNVLLTFGNVRNELGKGNDVFTRATQSALDMSVALGTDMQGATIQVAKALNDPIKGITALGKAGVSFTSDQKDMIKSLVKSGDTLGAQKIILKELENQFGGSAAAQATAGDRLKVVWGNLQEQLGGALLPVVEKVATFLADKLPAAFEAVGNAIKPLKNLFDNLVAGFKGGESEFVTGGAAGFYKFGEVVRTVVEKVGPLIRNIVAFIGEKFAEFKAFAQEVFPQVQEAIGHFIAVVTAIWKVWGDDLLRIVATIWNYIQETIENALTVVRGIIQFVLAIINGDWGKAWDALKSIVGAVWNQIGNIISTAFGVLRGLFGGIADSISSIWSGLWNGFKGVVDNAWVGIQNSVRNGVNSIIEGINKVIRALNLLKPGKDLGTLAPLAMVGRPATYDWGSYQPDQFFAKGGVVQGSPGSPQIVTAHAGEGVFTPQQMAAMSNGDGGGGGLTVIVQTAMPIATKRDITDAVIAAVEDHLANGGAIGNRRGQYLQAT